MHTLCRNVLNYKACAILQHFTLTFVLDFKVQLYHTGHLSSLRKRAHFHDFASYPVHGGSIKLHNHHP